MGSGKGKIKKFVTKISMNGILFIFKNIKKDVMLKIYKYIQYRLPIKVSLKTSTLKTESVLSSTTETLCTKQASDSK